MARQDRSLKRVQIDTSKSTHNHYNLNKYIIKNKLRKIWIIKYCHFNQSK